VNEVKRSGCPATAAYGAAVLFAMIKNYGEVAGLHPKPDEENRSLAYEAMNPHTTPYVLPLERY